MITAKELIEKMSGATTEELMIEFAKLHVKESLTAAHHAAIYEMDGRGWTNVYNKRFLLQCYPENKIN
jgi:hypothetical protein